VIKTSISCMSTGRFKACVGQPELKNVDMWNVEW